MMYKHMNQLSEECPANAGLRCVNWTSLTHAQVTGLEGEWIWFLFYLKKRTVLPPMILIKEIGKSLHIRGKNYFSAVVTDMAYVSWHGWKCFCFVYVFNSKWNEHCFVFFYIIKAATKILGSGTFFLSLLYPPNPHMMWASPLYTVITINE